MVSPLLNDLRNPILSSFFLLCKFLQIFLISGGFSFDCSAVAGVFRISVVILRRLCEDWCFRSAVAGGGLFRYVAGAFELLIGFVEPAIAGDFQVSIGFVPPTVCFALTTAEVGYFVYRCGWWNSPVCFGRCLFRIGGG